MTKSSAFAVAFATQLSCTSIHELGHVFDLWHVESSPNFLASSPPDRPPGPAAHRFTPDHRRFLSMTGASDFVTPGGTPFGVRGPGLPTDNDPSDAPRSPKRLRLTIDTCQREFWYFEPVELDIALTVASDAKQTRVPDVIDPGYDAFTIWIERPDGTRDRYRPTTRFCESPGDLVIKRGQPYQRDIPIFGQSGGYTFQSAGCHRIWCTLTVDGRVVTSNTLDVYLKTTPRHGTRYERLRTNLRDRRHAQLLFYKAAERPCRQMDALITAAKDIAGTSSEANIRYSLARALVRAAPQRAARRRECEEQAAEQFDRSLESGNLGPVREQKAIACLSMVSGR